MRVLQMIDTLKWGGAQKMQVFLAQSLRPLGVGLTLASLGYMSNSTIQAELESLGVEVVSFPFRALFSPLSFLRLVQHIQRNRYDLIHAHLTYSNIVATLAGKITGTPVIASQRTAGVSQTVADSNRYKFENWVVRNGATRIMGNGWAVAEFAGQRFAPRPVDVLPNAIDLIPSMPESDRRTLRTALVGDPDRPIILSVGRLSTIKNFGCLITAFAALHAEYPSAALIIAGGGNLRPTLETQIEQLGLKGHVFLLGPRSDVPRLLGASDIYVNASQWEGLPVSVLEAMAAGLPSIATRVGDTPHLMVPGTGILIDPGQPDQIKQAIVELLTDPSKRQAIITAAHDHIQQNYSRKDWTCHLLAMYAKVTPAALPVIEAFEKA